jgi:hypothetical protein
MLISLCHLCAHYVEGLVVSLIRSSEAYSIPDISSVGQTGPDEEALVVLDTGYETREIDSELLSPERASEMRRGIRRALASISSLNVEELVARQGWLQRLTGADIETRLTFELAAKQVEAMLEALRTSSERARKLLASMEDECISLRDGQSGLAELIAFGERVAGRDDRRDPSLSDRFGRRLSNLIAIHAANEMAIAQFGLAAAGLKALLDRYSDISTVVVPIWRQHLFAILHTSGRLRLRDTEVQNFMLCQSALEEYFSGELQI